MLAAVRALVPGLVAFLAVAALLAGQTGPEGANAFLPFLEVGWRDGSAAILWWIGALGLGLSAVDWLRTERRRTQAATTGPDELALALVLGCALELALDSVLGSLGALMALGGLVPWILAVAGTVLGIRSLRDAPVAPWTFELRRSWFVPAAFGAMAALLLLAASSAPGWLWSSEFGGYDALSYHLALPKRWIEDRAPVGPVDGNVYSALPSFVEAAFMHLMILRRDTIYGALACQWWAALATLATAFAVARLAERAVGPRTGAIAALAFLATPWVVVTGSLAYNDVAPCLLLAGGWLLLLRATDGGRTLDGRSAAALALIAAAAVGAKPTAIFFVALPLLAITILEARPKALGHAPLAAGVGALVLAPWFVRNAVGYGNPLFPFASILFGPGTWSAEQHEIFARAHSPGIGLLARPVVLAREWIAHGLGAAPPNEPWFPQWGALPAAGLAGLAFGFRANRHARAALAAIGIACLGWLFLTHLKSRFLLPTAIPLALGATMLLRSAAAAATRIPDAGGRALAFGAAVVAAMLPFVVYLREPVRLVKTGSEPPAMTALGQPAALVDGIAFRTGAEMAERLKDADEGEARQLLSLAATPFLMNYNYVLPAEARVIGIGYATPFYVARPIATTTVWDRGDFDEVVEEHPDAPATWGAGLRERGFTHALLEPNMVGRWMASGWLNPRLSKGDWAGPFLRSNRVLAQTSDGCLVIELGPRQPPPQQAQPSLGAPLFPAPTASQPDPGTPARLPFLPTSPSTGP